MPDSTFHPGSERAYAMANEARTAPSTRLLEHTKLSPGGKKRVKTVDPNHGRCLIENCDEARAVEFAHCIPRSLRSKEEMLSNLEWHWDMKYYTLNLDTRYNIFRLGASLRHIHDNPEGGPRWMLIPEDHIIEEYRTPVRWDGEDWVCDRGTFPTWIEDQSDKFRYRLLPILGRMENVAIHRQNRIPSRERSLTSNDFTTYLDPFENLPMFESHLRPKFAILEAGRKMMFDLDWYKADFLKESYPILKKVLEIFGAWTHKRPDDAEYDKDYNPDPADDDGDGDHERGSVTSSRRTGPGRGEKRKRQPDSPTPVSKNTRPNTKNTGGRQNKGHKQGSSSGLSEKTLLEQELGKGSWTRAAVKTWSEKCCNMTVSNEAYVEA
ncbi:hypothetical protein AX17_004049 [Amanita inopinata Kibby_2008]|nr:hypothetical protein AX17_004049 [Amanita inopinata Kibby_2008]